MALDIGDKWTGVALSDPLGILAKPYDTAQTNNLTTFLQKILSQESVTTVVVGLPTTLRGTESEQTKKIIAHTEELKKQFPLVEWKLWDERFTSKQASSIKKTKTKQDKLHSHAIAAALILSGYLEFQRFHTLSEDDSSY